MHKLACALVALVMAIGICVPTAAFAATETYKGDDAGSGEITIKDAQENETYSLYKMLNLSYSADPESYAYTVTDEWKSFFTEGAGATYFDVDDNGYVTIKEGVTLESDSSDMAALAKAALAYAENEDNHVTAMLTVTADSEGATFEGLPFGWYLVGTTLGSLCSIDTVNKTVTINEKNPTPTADKEVVDEDEGTFEKGETDGKQDNAAVGDKLEYKVTISDVAHSSSLCLHDEVTAGLDFQEGSIKVYLNTMDDEGAENAAGNYTIISQSECEDKSCIFEISFDDAWLDTLDTGDVIIVTYEVVVNEDAVVIHGNDAWVTFGADSRSVDSKTETDTYGFELKKVDSDDNTKLLDGATFTLTDSAGKLIEFYYNADTKTYIVHDAIDSEYAEETTTTDIVVTGGDVYIFGLEEGTYTLTETAAPAGYNILSEPIEITITQVSDDGESWTVTTSSGSTSGSVDSSGTITWPTLTVENNSGDELPSTGGMGTTIFYIIGGILVVGAVVLLITRRRMNNRA